jgi:hypothetical protein
MEGSIYQINPTQQMFAVTTDEGGFSIFEIINEAECELGDSVTWRNDTGLGSESLNNLSKNKIAIVAA